MESSQETSEGHSGENRNDDYKKGLWTAEEDTTLAECVQKFKEGNWSTIALKSGLNRSGKSCRLRWVKHLSPAVRNGPLSDEEQRKVIELQAVHGNKWALMAALLPGRSDNTIKNFWNSHRKRLLRRQQQLQHNLPSPLRGGEGKGEGSEGGTGGGGGDSEKADEDQPESPSKSNLNSSKQYERPHKSRFHSAEQEGEELGVSDRREETFRKREREETLPGSKSQSEGSNGAGQPLAEAMGDTSSSMEYAAAAQSQPAGVTGRTAPPIAAEYRHSLATTAVTSGRQFLSHLQVPPGHGAQSGLDLPGSRGGASGSGVGGGTREETPAERRQRHLAEARRVWERILASPTGMCAALRESMPPCLAASCASRGGLDFPDTPPLTRSPPEPMCNPMAKRDLAESPVKASSDFLGQLGSEDSLTQPCDLAADYGPEWLCQDQTDPALLLPSPPNTADSPPQQLLQLKAPPMLPIGLDSVKQELLTDSSAATQVQVNSHAGMPPQQLDKAHMLDQAIGLGHDMGGYQTDGLSWPRPKRHCTSGKPMNVQVARPTFSFQDVLLTPEPIFGRPLESPNLAALLASPRFDAVSWAWDGVRTTLSPQTLPMH